MLPASSVVLDKEVNNNPIPIYTNQYNLSRMRIYQALKKSGKIRSKRQFEELADAQRITVNGKIIKSEHYFVKENDKISINNQTFESRIAKKKIQKILVLLHKPKDYTCQLGGKRYPSVMKLIDLPRELKNTISPVGRLDVPTSGLLILTNDGKLAHDLLNDGTEKEYIVTVEKQVVQDEIDQLRNGVQIQIETNRGIEPYVTKPAKVKLLKSNRKESKIQITITEGKKRQIRLMCDKIGHPVVELKRVRIGEYKLGKIPLNTFQVYSLDEEKPKKKF